MKTIFDLCEPRKDVKEGRARDEEFAADLSRVISGEAEPVYGDPATFFRYTYPTRGVKNLLETVCRRLSGKGGELNSVVRLDTQYGGGKTHSLIALVHAVQGMQGVANADEFVDASLLPAGKVRVAALDGERADPANGLKLEEGLLARSLWGEMAYHLAGRGGLRRDLSGSWSPCSKEAIKRLLRDREVRVLVCTDAAGEGLNLQSCGVLVNYDLPWNPMKVEQRIGRIDRIGQPHEKIRIINLAYADTVEADVYFALSARIGLFKGVVGKLQPILSHLPREFEGSIFAPKEQRERIRHDLVNNVQILVDQAEQAAFDIDEVSDADLQPPKFPASPLTPEDLDAVLHREDLLPPGVECTTLDPRTFRLTLPGYEGAARVTASPAVFDDHFESVQYVSPDSPVFREMVKRSGAEGVVEPHELEVGKLSDLIAEPS
jgi:helicase-like protein